MNTIRFQVDGVEIEAEQGCTVLQACLAAEVYIPHLCSHPCLPAQSTCKLCVVEVEGEEVPLTACSTPAEEGMKVVTKGERLDRIRRVAIELMLAGHPHDCMGCRSYTNCEFQALIQYLGVTHARMHTIHRITNRINTVNPLIDRELERCVQCGRCVRVCSEVRGVGVLKYRKKDGECYIGTENDKPLAETDCRFCSACVEICPTGALQDRAGHLPGGSAPWRAADPVQGGVSRPHRHPPLCAAGVGGQVLPGRWGDPGKGPLPPCAGLCVQSPLRGQLQAPGPGRGGLHP